LVEVLPKVAEVLLSALCSLARVRRFHPGGEPVRIRRLEWTAKATADHHRQDKVLEASEATEATEALEASDFLGRRHRILGTAAWCQCHHTVDSAAQGILSLNRHPFLAAFLQLRRCLWTLLAEMLAQAPRTLLAEMLAQAPRIPSPRNQGCLTKPLTQGCKEPRIPHQGRSRPEAEAHRLTTCKVFEGLSRMATVRCTQFPTMLASSSQWIWGGRARLLHPLATSQQANTRPTTRRIQETVVSSPT